MTVTGREFQLGGVHAVRGGHVEDLGRRFELRAGLFDTHGVHGLAFTAQATHLGQLQKTFEIGV
ncbi:hypothetical protein D3C78_1854520 [compost metagenome]